jgi:hypothetical protein
MINYNNNLMRKIRMGGEVEKKTTTRVARIRGPVKEVAGAMRMMMMMMTMRATRTKAAASPR